MMNFTGVIRSINKQIQTEAITVKTHFFLRLASFPFNYVLPLVPKSGLIADIGCGYGIFSYMLALTEPKLKVIAYDPSSKKIAVARRFLNGVKNVHVYPPTKTLPKLNQKLTAVVLLEVLCLIPNKEKKALLHQCVNNLKPGGKIIISFVPKEKSFRYYLAFLQEIIMVKILKATYSINSTISFDTTQQLHTWLTDLGFKDIHCQKMPNRPPYYHKHLLIVGTKK